MNQVFNQLNKLIRVKYEINDKSQKDFLSDPTKKGLHIPGGEDKVGDLNLTDFSLTSELHNGVRFAIESILFASEIILQH